MAYEKVNTLINIIHYNKIIQNTGESKFNLN